MTYAVAQDIIDRKGNDAYLAVADREHTGTADVQAVTDALSDASNTIDSYVGQRFDLPLAIVPVWAVRICVDLAMYFLADSGGAITDDITKRYDNAIAFLKDFSVGKAGLGVAHVDEPQTDDAGEVKGDILVETERPRLFSRGGRI